MESIYTTSVSNVPADYNDPTSNYKKHVWIAVLGILAFFAFYLFLTYWFFNSAYRLLSDASGGGNSSFMSIGVGVASLFLGIFMIKAFFFVQTKYESQDRQVTPENEPVLFDYLHKLADEIGAPRPHKVYLSNRVNASVFYDLSFLNLFFPSKKNLEIGLGLINILNLGEFKAVLAHEYGHFAQKSMLVGRWVYIANQIANSIITRRDILDNILAGLSRFDLRIAWIGWILSIIVWSIRSLVELIFRIVILSQRALSREMEFQADLVAVSVTGSDALINALHKLQAADAALSDAMNALGDQLNKGKAVEDLYAIQTNSVEKTAYILDDDEYGKSPNIPSSNPETHRVFSDKIAQPPKMWLTHPPDQEREANAKQRYIPAHIDDRDAWDLFSDPQATRLLLTKDIIDSTKAETELMPSTQAIEMHNKQFDKSYFKPDYRGVYLNRFFCQQYDNSEDMYISDLSVHESGELIASLYPETLIEELEDFTTLQDEMLQLEAIKDKKLDSSGEGGIWHRGTQIRRSELPGVIVDVKSEVKQAQEKVASHDRKVRSVHLKLAEKIGNGWSEYLKGLLRTIHYCEHNILNIQDSRRILQYTLGVVMADNKVSETEMTVLLRECNEVHHALYSVFKNQEKITLGQDLIKELALEADEVLFEKLGLPQANRQNVNDWINAIDGWSGSYINSLSRLRAEALELLIRAEDQVVKMHQTQDVHGAGSPTVIDTEYLILTSGTERESSLKLSLWDKFISADGIVPAVTKFAVAASIVGGTVFMANHTGMSDLSIYNGLGQAVSINIDGTTVQVQPHSHIKTDMTSSGDAVIKAETLNGQLIETFQPKIRKSSSHYVYNVASASALVQYRVYYGSTPGDDDYVIGNTRWSTTRADYIFEEAPNEISTSSKRGTSKDVLMGMSKETPMSILGTISGEQDQIDLIKSHILWDPKTETHIGEWISIAGEIDGLSDALSQRLKNNPNEVMTIRAIMDGGSEEVKERVCQEFNAKASKDSNDALAYYISARCMEGGPEQAQRFITGAEKWPDHGWLNYAASHYYSYKDNWQKAYDCLLTAHAVEPSLRPTIAMNLERIARLMLAQGKSLQNAKKLPSQYLDFYESVENGSNEDPYVQALYHIHKGELDKAYALAPQVDESKENIIAICAVSDGGKQEWIDEAIIFKSEKLHNLGLYAVASLRVRQNLSLADLEENLKAHVEGYEMPIMDFIQKTRVGNYSEAEKILNDTGMNVKASMCAFAYMMNGARIPKEWKLQAKHFLFPTEKPFIK